MATYETTITDKYTGNQALIKSNDPFLFKEKISRRLISWEKDHYKELKKQELEDAKENAEELTKDAKEQVEAFKNILRATLSVNDEIDWSKLQDKTSFREYFPSEVASEEDFLSDYTWNLFVIDIVGFNHPLIHVIFKGRYELAREKAGKVFQSYFEEYKKQEEERKAAYEKERTEFLEKQTEYNQNLVKKREEYESGSRNGVTNYINLVLERSSYPPTLNLNFGVFYEENSRLVLIDMNLPHPSVLPLVTEYRYINSLNEIEKKFMTDKESESFYNSVIYQICLRTIHEMFESDYKDTVDTVVFNGWVSGIDPQTGKDFLNCVLSLQAGKDEFKEINLEKINPEGCFHYLKGVTAGPLVNLSPVKPIMHLNKVDKRIIESKGVITGLDENTNLATMAWQDFEVLIRDLVEKEFSREDCVVKVTRASRDEGVDAIAFDEDPIRGGKYIIQAKRYNNVVPLSAVRDLYGTVVNEGAVKGILVTTSYYGKDSFNFAKDKPLKLINGEELIYMFNKHGYDFRIELQRKRQYPSSTPY
ncbi:MAG: restriction endonuclease [bacterium]|nr:restriction endonuclease [bacterium]